MAQSITAQEIKDLRKHYGLTQQAFAKLLGIGEASMNRYEKGATPTKANENLLRAAMIPEFMADCLAREGSALTERQRESVQQVIYSEMTFNEEGEVMDVNELYTLTLQQEVLNEKAWDVMAQASRLRSDAIDQGDLGLAALYEDIELQIAKLVPNVLSNASTNPTELAEIRGKLSSFQDLIEARLAKAA